MIRALVAKEWRQNRRVLVGASLLAVSQLALLISFVLTQESPTLLRAATAFAWGAGPVLAALSARRLFVVEHEQGTISLLRALPVHPTQLTAAKLFAALVVNLTFTLGALWVVALLVQRQELIPPSWLFRLSLQVASYMFAWVAIACLMAHLGVYRHAVWLLLLLFLLGLEDVVYEPTRHLFWTAPLADALELTRYQAPWDGIALAMVWGLAATALTFALAGYRGGAWVDALYAPMSARRRAQVTAGLFATLLAFEIGSDLAKHSASDAGGLPRVGQVAYAYPDLEPLARRLNTELEVLAPLLETTLPLSTLAWRHDHRPEAALSQQLGGDEVLIALDPAVSQEDLLREALTDVLAAHTGFQLEENPKTGAWAVGFAAYWLQQRAAANIDLVERRACVLGQRALSAELEDYHQVRASHGRGGAEALGWVAWQVVADGGAQPLDQLAKRLFSNSQPHNSLGKLSTRRLSPLDLLKARGLPRRAIEGGVQAKLQSLRGHCASLPTLSPPLYEDDMARLGALSWTLPPELDPQRVRLWWSTAEPLSLLPLPHTPLRELPVQTGAGRVALPADPRDRVVATWLVDGVSQGWTELPRR